MSARTAAPGLQAVRWRTVGRGDEGSIAVGAAPGGKPLRLKRFGIRADLCRYAINGALLDRERRRLGYEADVRLPRILAVDPEALTVISEFIARRPVRSAAARDRRTTAMNAMIAIGGYVGDYGPSEVRAALLAEGRADLAALGPRPPFRGLDLNETNWVFDGASWALVDF